MPVYRRLGGASLAVLICASTALAEEAETKIEEIVVNGKYLSLDKLDSVKTPTPIIDIPQSLSIISADQIEKQSFTNLGDVLRYTPGLSISQGEGHRDAIIIRGIETTADFFIDGLRDDVQYFRPLYNLERVEILRGSNALLFGRGGGGGVVNRVTKSPEFDDQFAGFSSSLDTFGSYNISGDVNMAVSETAALRLNGFYEELDNHRDFFGGERFAINPTFAFKASSDTNVLLSYEYVDDDRVVDRGVTSQVVENGPNVPLKGFKKTFFGSPDGNRTTLQAHIAKARVDHTFTDSLRGNLTVQYADYDKLYQNLFANSAIAVGSGLPLQVQLDGYQDFTDRQNLIIQTNLVSEFKTGPFGHTVLFGGEFGDQDTDNSRNDNVFAANGDDQITIAFTDPLDIPEFSFSNQVRDRKSQVQFASVYLQDQIDVTDWLILVGGVRYDRFDIDVLDIIEQNDGDGVNGDFSRVDEKFTPRLGAILKPAENISAYASYSETFLPRSGDQFLTLDLDTESTRPQSFKNTELGLKWDIRPDLSITAALFDLDRSSFTSVDPDDPGQVIVVEGSQTQGFELQLNGKLTDRWTIAAGYSYLDGKVQQADGGGNNGNKTRQTPENMISLWNDVSITDKFGIGFGATYQDSYFVREDNAVKVPDFIRVDAALYYELSDNLRLQVNVENLLDETYFPDAHSNTNISTGEPINARFTIVGRF
ncbi:iron transport receptor protein [Iodidimonas muriae]|uniref:Iron transport receptor protein n=1 Tax=Iodidimonas muriae TaxID=261467 RepID=A0ABQ2LEN0_9PROT|nr:TonB-dependent siderophore receptor [Iodidimonas muriae]GGO13911.1 iron transport receptor protein [Iodidimonas muriae]